jgi:hypothetical protein
MSGKIFLEQIKMLVPPTEDGHLARLMDVEERFAHAQLPANTDLNGVWDSGEYYAASASAAASILNKPTDFPTGNYNFLLKVEKPVDSSAFSIQRLSLVSQAAVGSAAEWVRTGDTGSGNWSAWRRLMTDADISPAAINPHEVRAWPWDGLTRYVKLGEFSTTTASGNSYHLHIDYSGGNDAAVTSWSMGSLMFHMRNNVSNFEISTRLTQFGDKTNGIHFGYTTSQTTPGATITLYCWAPMYTRLDYKNVASSVFTLTANGSITSETTEPAGLVTITPISTI